MPTFWMEPPTQKPTDNPVHNMLFLNFLWSLFQNESLDDYRHAHETHFHTRRLRFQTCRRKRHLQNRLLITMLEITDSQFGRNSSRIGELPMTSVSFSDVIKNSKIKYSTTQFIRSPACHKRSGHINRLVF